MKYFFEQSNPIILLSIVLLLFSQAILATEIITGIDRNPVSINESFQITYSASQTPDDDPDFSPLEKDFEILSQSQQSSSSWINGQSSKTIQWVLNVMAKRTGNLIIPAISFGDDLSQIVKMKITETATATINKHEDDIFLEVETSPEITYVQSQIIYSLKLYRKVQITQASLNEPEMEDAIIEKLGEDSNYKKQVNGVEYIVTERKYAIFPQKSGLTTIAPLVLTAQVVTDTRPRFNGFFNTPKTKTKRVRSKAISLNILAAPENFTGKHWIPAEQVYMEEKWSGDISKMKIGEPLTRTLTLLAKGTTVSQLPEIHSELEISQLKTYPDQPNLKEQKKPDGIIAFREEKIAYIPSKPGTYTIPAIEIPWFNTRTQTMELASLPETIVTAIGAAIPEENTMNIALPIQTTSINSNQMLPADNSNFWMWVSMVLAMGWLITLVCLFKKPTLENTDKQEDPKEAKLKDIIKALKTACAENNNLATRESLLAWGKIKYNKNNLTAIANLCEARLRDEIIFLNQSLYAEKTTQWQGKKLFQAFIENKAQEKIIKNRHDGLEPLYKL